MKFIIMLAVLLSGQIKAEVLKNSLLNREISLIVSDNGPFPQKIIIFTDEKIRLFLTNIGKNKQCFYFPTKKIFIAVPFNDLTSIDLEMNQAGEFQYTCPGSTLKGSILVLERGEIRPKSFIQKKYLWDNPEETNWVPREY